MNLITVTTILCLISVLVDARERNQVISRSQRKLKQRSNQPGKKRSKLQLTKNVPLLKSYDISSSVKGVVCTNEGCYQYGSNPSTIIPDGTANWIIKVENTMYLCYNKDFRRCPRVYGDKYEKYDGNKKPDNNELKRFAMVICTQILICFATNNGSCPYVPIVEKEWKYITTEKVYTKTIRSLIIVCVATNMEKCYKKHGPEKWDEKSDLPDYSGVMWYVILEGVKYYCKETEKKGCPSIEGIHYEMWKRYCNGTDVEECDEHLWHVRIGRVTIFCEAHEIEECSGILDRNWVLSDQDRTDDGTPKGVIWQTLGSDVKVYCDANAVNACPKLKEPGLEWGPLPEETVDDEVDAWELSFKGTIIICKAVDIEDCEEIRPGKWKPSQREEDDDGVPHGVVRVIIVGKVKIYCDAKVAKSCPKLKKGGNKWQELEPLKADDGKSVAWELEVQSEIIICVANNMKQCKKLRNGNWVPSDHQIDDNGVPKSVHWIIISRGIKVYCVAKDVKSCPRIKGKNWDPIGGKPGNVQKDKARQKNLPNDGREVDVAVIAPQLIEGLRYVQGNDDNVVLLCYCKNKRDCPDGKKWKKKTTKDVVGEKLSNFIKTINVWVKKIRETHIVCVAEEVKSCKPEGDGWVIISGMKSHLFVAISKKNTQMYCEAEDVNSCPYSVGQWVLVSKDQWEQTTVELKKKGEMWRIVTFEYTIYCDAKYMGCCPYIEDYTWHTVFGNGIDLKVFDKHVRFMKTIRNTLYHCKAKLMDVCPPLFENAEWETVEGAITVANVLEFFKDIVNFAEACSSGICKMKQKYDPFSD